MSLNPLGRHLAHSRALAAQSVEDKIELHENTSRLRHSIREALSSDAALAWCFAAGTLSGAGRREPKEEDEGFSISGLVRKVGGTFLLGQILGD